MVVWHHALDTMSSHTHSKHYQLLANYLLSEHCTAGIIEKLFV